MLPSHSLIGLFETVYGADFCINDEFAFWRDWAAVNGGEFFSGTTPGVLTLFIWAVETGTCITGFYYFRDWSPKFLDLFLKIS